MDHPSLQKSQRTSLSTNIIMMQRNGTTGKAWKIMPASKWLEPPPFMSHDHLEGEQPNP